MPNQSDGFDLCCPNCGNTGSLMVAVTTFAEAYPDGSTDQTGDVEFNGDSYCRCQICNTVGKVYEFIKEFAESEASEELKHAKLFTEGLKLSLAASGWEGKERLLALGLGVSLELMDKALESEEPLTPEEVNTLADNLGFSRELCVKRGQVLAKGFDREEALIILDATCLTASLFESWDYEDGYLAGVIHTSEELGWPGWQDVICLALSGVNHKPEDRARTLGHWLKDIPEAREELEEEVSAHVS